MSAASAKAAGRPRSRNAEQDGAPVTWQAEKSAQARLRLLEATLDSLADLGYFGTTVSTIVDYAGMSRGSIRHYFRTKAEIIAATIELLNERRLAAYREDLYAKTADQDSLDYVLDTFWKHLTERDFAAHQELVIASRTDKELHGVLKPALEDLSRRWMAINLERFPEWRRLGDSLPVAAAIGALLLEGMAYRRIIGDLSPEFIEGILDYLKQQLRTLFDPSRFPASEKAS